MDKNHFDEVLDYGLFDSPSDLDFDPSDLSYLELTKDYKYFTKVKSKEGQIILFLSKYSTIQPGEGDIGFINKEKIKDGKYPLSSGGWVLLIENGVLSKWLRLENYRDKQKGINFQIETIFPFGVQMGNLVLSDGKPVPDGNYSTGRWSSIYVHEGRIANDENEIIKLGMPSNNKIQLTLASLFFTAGGIFTLLNVLKNNSQLVELFLISLVGSFFLLFGIVSFYWGVFYNIKFEKDRIINNLHFFSKPVLKKEIIGYFFSKKETGEYLVLVKENGKCILFDSNPLGDSYNKLKKLVIKNFRTIPKKEREKYPFNINEYQYWIRKNLGLWGAINGFIFLLISIFMANLNVMLLSSIFVIFGGIIYRYFGKKIQTIDI